MILRIENDQKNFPYATIPGSDRGKYHLGERSLLKIRLPHQLFGIDPELARAEAVPILIHNVVDGQMGSGDVDYAYPGLTIVTNFMLPDTLQHAHPELTRTKALKLYTFTPQLLVSAALDELESLSSFGNELPQHPYVQALRPINYSHLMTMLEGSKIIPNPKAWRVEQDGTMYKSKNSVTG